MQPETAEALPWLTVIIGAGVMFLGRWLIFTAIIWGMLKVQGLNYTWPGLLLTTALASIAYLVPLAFVGAGIGLVVIYIGLKKVTEAEHTDLMFTIVIGNALMYVTGLWMLAAVLPSAEELSGLNDAAVAEDTGFFPDYAGMLNQASNTFTQAAARGETGTNAAARRAGASKPAATGAAGKPAGFELKGITMMSNGSLAMIRAGDRTETVAVKGLLTVRGPQGVTRYVCESITTNLVVLRRQGSEPPERIELKLE